jgi:hypothetical protein
VRESPISQRALVLAPRLALILLLAIPFAHFLYVAISRITYPFEIEWLEGEMAVAALRFIENPSLAHLYPPTGDPDFIPHLYPPVYHVVVAALFKLSDSMHLGWGRLVSLFATLGAMAGIGAIVHAWTRSWFAALCAALLYPMFFKASGYWYDLVRVDSLAYLFAVWAAYFMDAGRARWWKLALGCTLSYAAFFTKQTSIFIPALVLFFRGLGDVVRLVRCFRFGAHRVFRRWRRIGSCYLPFLSVLLVFGVATLSTGILIQREPLDAMFFYLLDMPSRHPIFWTFVHQRAPQSLWQHYTFLVWMLPLALWATLLTSRGGTRRSRIILIVLGAFLAVGTHIFAHSGQSMSPPAAPFHPGPFDPVGFAEVIRYVGGSWTSSILPAAALAAGAFGALTVSSLTGGPRLHGGRWVMLLFAAQHVAAVAWVKIGGYLNNFIPLFIVSGVVAGLAIHWLLTAARRPLAQGIVVIGFFGVFALTWFGTTEFAAFWSEDGEVSGEHRRFQKPISDLTEAEAEDWNPLIIDGLRYHRPPDITFGGQIPSDESRRGWEAWIDRVRHLNEDGGVYLPHHNYLGLLAGVPRGPSIDAIRDANYAGQRTPPSLLARIRNRQFRYLLMDFPLEAEWVPGDFRATVGRHYQDPTMLELREPGLEVPVPLTGAPVRPIWLYER